MPDFHYATWKGSQAFSPWQQWGKKEGTLVIYGTGKDLTAHQIHFDGSYRSKCTAGDNIVRLRSGFLALFGKADTIVSTLLSVAESVCVCVCVCHLTVVIIMHTAGRLDELIPLWYTHARALALKKSSASLMEQGRQDAWRAHASGAGDSSVWRRLAENFKVKFKCPAPRLTDTHTPKKLTCHHTLKRKYPFLSDLGFERNTDILMHRCLYEKCLKLFPLMIFSDLLSFQCSVPLTDSWHNWLEYWLQLVLQKLFLKV